MKTSSTVRWADFSSDEEQEPPIVEKSTLRWADLSDDDEDQDVSTMAEDDEDLEMSTLSSPQNSPREEEQVQKPGARNARPTFDRPTREKRVQQIKKVVDEFMGLNFDEVKAEEQPGLVLRMQSILKSLASSDVYWHGKAKFEEPRYALLGFCEDDMYAIGDRIRKADKSSEKRQFREAFGSCSEAKPWLSAALFQETDPDAIVSLRAAWKKSCAKRESKKALREANRLCEDYDGQVSEEWSDVKAKSKKAKNKDDLKVSSGAVNQRHESRHECVSSSSAGYGRRVRGEVAHGKALDQPKQRGASMTEQQSTVDHHHQHPALASTSAPEKAQSQFLVGIEEEPRFRVCRKLLGVAGANMKRINNETGARLRLRGQGSKFLEGPLNQESTDPLMLCISAPDQRSHDRARSLVEELLTDIYSQYSVFCKQRGLPSPSVQVKFHDGARGYSNDATEWKSTADAW
jgi:hypothetical protein